MKALLQRVSSSKVEVEGKVVGQISKGLLVFIGIEKQDDIMSSDKMVKKILSYRYYSPLAYRTNYYSFYSCIFIINGLF